MKRFLLATIVVAAAGMFIHSASGENPQTYCYRQSQYLPWHNGYYDPAWGEPHALVVPPTAEFQCNYGWGVGGTRVAPIYHQFGRPFPGYYGYYGGGGAFRPIPQYPSDTQQFGVYYIRGPW